MSMDIDRINQRLETLTPQDILIWAWETFGPRIAATSSFQTQSVPLLHMIAEVTLQLPVFFLDTGFHFPETLAYRDRLIATYGLNVEVLRAGMGHDDFLRRFGDLYRRDPDRCCYINKVEPLRRAMRGLKAWISGIRRDQTPERRHTPVVSLQDNGIYKICPMVTWTRRDVWKYIADYDLPEHPLLTRGYLSVGCAPCTRPVGEDEDERAGRWSGQAKAECGLHTMLLSPVFSLTPKETKEER
ncbi:MAG: phosphoadenylyl-sulfate reductase [Chloroflexi bacterium]|nr:phosphoadenylyl-sulfate reductase [Chloroflexota bacterium]